MSFVSRIRKLASETAIYGLSTVFARMINFLLVPFYINLFPPDAYGVVVLVFTVFVFFNVLYQYGMEAAYLKFASDDPSDQGRQRTFSTATWSILGTSVLFSLLVVGLRDPLGALFNIAEAWRGLLLYAAAILALDALSAVPYAELRLQNRPWRFAAIRMISIAVNVGLNLLLILKLGFGIEAIFIANVAASATAVLLLLPIYLRRFRFVFDRPLWGELMRFGLPFVPGGLGYAIAERINAPVLASMTREQVLELYGNAPSVAALANRPGVVDADFGEHIAGVFSAVMKLAIFMSLIVQMFRFAWQPFFLQHANDPDARPLFARIFTLFNGVALLVVLGVSFFAVELAQMPLPGGRTLFPVSYQVGLGLVPIMLFGYLFLGWYYNFAAGAYIEKQTKYFVPCMLSGAGLSVGLNVLLVPHFGMAAAAWAVVLSYALMAILLHLLVRRAYPIPYAWGRVLSTGLLAIGLLALWFALPFLQVWYLEAGLLVAYIVGLVGLQIIPPDRLRQLWRRIRGTG